MKNRANCRKLLSILQPKLVRHIPMQTLNRTSEEHPNIRGMSYNLGRDELFLADDKNKVVRNVRAMRVRDKTGDLRDAYRAPYDFPTLIRSVCHMSDSDTLLVCSHEGPIWNYADLAGGTEPQRERVARDAPRADRRIWTNQLRAE